MFMSHFVQKSGIAAPSDRVPDWSIFEARHLWPAANAAKTGIGVSPHSSTRLVGRRVDGGLST